MKFYKLVTLRDEKNESENIFCNSKKIYNIDRYDVLKGKKINNWNKNITLFYDSEKGNILTDYLENVLGWFVVSTKLKNIIEELDKNAVQFLPINIESLNGDNKLNGYYVANILQVIDAVNWELSDYREAYVKKKNITIKYVRKYVFNREAIKDAHIFKIPNKVTPIFVSQRFRNVIENNKITKCQFREIKVI